MSDVKLTPTQLQILRNIRDHGDAFRGFSGMAAYGGVTRSLMSLAQKGLVDGYEATMTDAGREALDAIEERIRARQRR
jgi:DNA-binding MarR family transcriptional regulator